MARRRRLGSGQKRHWSQSALAAAGGVAKMARRGFQMARVVHRVRRVVRRVTAGRRRRAVPGKGEHVGVFTKCWNSRIKRRSKATIVRKRKFASRVREALSRELARQCVIQEFGLRWAINASSVGAPPYSGRAGWCQLGLDVLNNWANPTYSLAQSYYDPALSNNANPPGLVSLLVSGTSNGSSTVDNGWGTTLYNVCNVAGVNPGGMDQVHRFELGPRRMHVTLRNPNTFGYWLDIFYCRPTHSLLVGDFVKSNFAGAQGSQPYQATSEMSCTPLELMAMGYPEVTTYGSTYHGYVKHASPQESPLFRRHYKIFKKCRVYLPPGGTLEKALIKAQTRVLTTDYIQKYAVDRSTEFLLMRACPEVQIADTFGTPAVPVTSVAGFGLVGDVSWRYNCRQIQTTAVVDRVSIQARDPTTATLQAGQFEPVSRTI